MFLFGFTQMLYLNGYWTHCFFCIMKQSSNLKQRICAPSCTSSTYIAVWSLAALKFTAFPDNISLVISLVSRQYISGGNDSRKRYEKRVIFKIGTIHPHGLNERFSFIWSYPFIVSVFVQQGRTKALTSHLFTPLFMFIHLPLIYFAPTPRLLIDFKNSKWKIASFSLTKGQWSKR